MKRNQREGSGCPRERRFYMGRKERKNREINRREFMKIVGASGLALSSASFLGLESMRPAYGAVEGKDSAERAINGILSLKKKMKGNTLTVSVPSGSAGSFQKAGPLFKQATGVNLEFIVVPMSQTVEKAMNLAVTRSSKFDAIVVSNFGTPDLAEAKLAMDLTDLVKDYNPDVTGPDGVIHPLFMFGMYKGRVYGLNTDGDEMSLMLRRSLLTDPDKKKAFEDKYGYPLDKPELWDQLFDQIKFFTDKDKPFYGAWLYCSPYYAKTEWLQLFISQGIVPFDMDMRPQIAGPEGIKAFEELIAIRPYLHPGTSTGGWSEQYKAYGEGNIYATFAWPSFIKYMNMPDFSKVAGDLAVCKAPGKKLASGMILRPCRYQFGWTYIVNSYSKNPEMAYLLVQWLHSAPISAQILPIKGSVFDPYRYSHMEEDLLKLWDPTEYWKDTREALIFNIENMYPELQMRGGDEYQSRLDENVIAGLEGLKEPKQALEETAELWEKITERYGRESQKEQWRFLCSSFGNNLRKAMNLPDPPEWVSKLGA
jgi:multiple sugar transport system substrate-binding protein